MESWSRRYAPDRGARGAAGDRRALKAANDRPRHNHSTKDYAAGFAIAVGWAAIMLLAAIAVYS